MRGRQLTLLLLAAALAGACATRVVPAPPVTTLYPELMYPAVPRELAAAAGASRIEVGWRYLQSGDFAGAEREFAAALQQAPELYPARAAGGYVAFARKEYERALAAFDAAVTAAPTYVPALVGRGQTLMALDRSASALEAFEAALAVDGSLTGLRERVDVLRLRSLETIIEAARAATAGGRLDEAEQAYSRAVAASPESAFLHRERGLVARRRGTTAEAMTHFQRAAELDPGDAASLVQIGELLEAARDGAGAEAAYRRAVAIEPSADLEARLAALGERARDAGLPAEFRAIDGLNEVTRGDLAALIGLRLEDVLREAPGQDVVMTDVGGHWASQWITQVARAGILEPFANHTFQPRAGVTRADLAGAVSRLVALAAVRRPELRPYLAERPDMADMPTAHLSYPAAAVAVSSGLMPLLDGDRFEAARVVPGPEAAAVIRRVQALTGAPR
jgi:tetratricopeptide (TPR) repeat protein